MTAVVAGGSGFIGRHLQKHLEKCGYQVTVLTRDPKFAGQVHWNAKALDGWPATFEGADVVINLSGKSIASRMTEANRQEMRDSRLQTTELFGKAIVRAKAPPKAWINASAVGYYGDRDQEILTEEFSVGEGFLAELCADWESAANRFETPATRKCQVRTGFVLGVDGGALPAMVAATKSFVGGTLGSGRQWIPWIHIEDLCALIVWMAEQGGEGAYNGSAPNPVQNADLMEALRHVLHRPWAPPAPEWALRMAAHFLPADPELALVSQRAIPARALREGFGFKHTDLADALADLT